MDIHETGCCGAGDLHETFFGDISVTFPLPLSSDRRSRRLIQKPVYILARICTVRGPTHHPAPN